MSQLKHTEAVLKERAEQLRLVLEGADLGLWDWNIRSGEVKRNARWATMLGYTYEEIEHTTMQWSDFVHPDDRERAWASIIEVLEGVRRPTSSSTGCSTRTARTAGSWTRPASCSATRQAGRSGCAAPMPT
ncbi:PAS domain-containing protein [Thauera humireducens]|uniref:PAS domain-containing protein n=1 Tax=Thauera humireducens TaxID=1134435 RepID=UPI00311F9ED2